MAAKKNNRRPPLTGVKFNEKQKNLFAFIVIFLFFAYVFCCLPIGIGTLDESLYYTIAKRLAEGERMFVDEWKVIQTFTVFLILPYKIYVRLVGSTEGLILCMRYLYVAAELFFSLHVYRRLQKYGWIALLYTLMLTTVSPILNFSYYNITVNCVSLLLVERFACEEPPSRKKLVFFGLIASCAVLSHPILAIGYFAFTAQVLFLWLRNRKKTEKKAAFFFQPSLHEWTYITLGVVIAFVAFMLYLSSSYHFDFSALWQNFPELFMDPDYSFHASDQNNHFFRLFAKMLPALYCYGFVNSALGMLLFLATVVLKLMRKTRKFRFRLLVASCCVFFLSYIHLAYLVFSTTDRDLQSAFFTLPIVGLAVPMILFCAICFLLLETPRPMCLAFLQTAVIVSVLVDFTSFVCFTYAGLIALFPMLVCFRDVLAEISKERAELPEKEEKKTGRFKGVSQKKFIPALLAAAVIVPIVFFGGKTVCTYTLFPYYERSSRQKTEWQPMDQKIERGPAKGIVTTERIATQHDKMVDDMYSLRQLGAGPLYVHGTDPLLYLAADLPVGTYSTYLGEDLQLDRQLRYWELHPDKIPVFIYVMKYTSTNHNPIGDSIIQTEIEDLQKYFDVEITECEGGYILSVNGMY